MKAILVIDLSDDNLWKQTNDIYERMSGYKCSLKPMPQKRDYSNELADTRGNDMYMEGWNDCLEELEQ